MQPRLGVRDSFDLAWQDWQGSAAWDRLEGEHPEDEWARQWGRAYVDFAADDKLPWLQEQGVKFTPLVGWAERGGLTARAHGSSVPRFHVPGAPAASVGAVRGGHVHAGERANRRKVGSHGRL